MDEEHQNKQIKVIVWLITLGNLTRIPAREGGKRDRRKDFVLKEIKYKAITCSLLLGGFFADTCQFNNIVL